MRTIDPGHGELPLAVQSIGHASPTKTDGTVMLKTEKVERAIEINREELFRFGTALIFIVGIMLIAMARSEGGTDGVLLVVAAMIGGYMPMNIGANDVANNVGPAVGSQAITLTGAILIAAFFEAGGALIAGGDTASQ